MTSTKQRKGEQKKKQKKFQPCCDDYDLVEEQLLDEDNEIERIAILKYIYKKYPKIFWEAYGSQF